MGQSTVERADATRNRHALLAAARTILATTGVEGLSLDRLAMLAGVGVGTVYRRFGDRAGLAYALLDEEERRFQQAFLSGPSPLGPGALPVTRLRAFMHAYIDRLDRHADLLAVGEGKSPTARYASGAYRTHRTHLLVLLTQLCPEDEAVCLADFLLSLLDAGLFIHQVRELLVPVSQIKIAVDRLLTRLDLIEEE